MSTLVRRIRATPERAASDAWRLIVDLIAPEDGPARRQLLDVGDIASSIISTESPLDAPIVVRGKGPQVQLYCLYNDDAVSGDDTNEAALAQCPTEGDWVMSLPADESDLAWVRNALAKKSARVSAREKSEAFDEPEEHSRRSAAADAVIDKEAFLRP